tara:strand:+ start:22203 stop:25028 length:2826 start_codon:yes stop_codon:yes gene_type:complete
MATFLAYLPTAHSLNLIEMGDTKSPENMELAEHIGNEIYKEFQDKNRMFDDADIELEIENGDFSVDGRWSRNVYDDHTPDRDIEGEAYGEDDLSKYRVVSTLFTRFRYRNLFDTLDNFLGVDLDLGTGAEYGFSFNVARKELPGSLIDQILSKGSDYIDNNYSRDDARRIHEMAAQQSRQEVSNLLMIQDPNCFICESANSFTKQLKRFWHWLLSGPEAFVRWLASPFNDDEKVDKYLEAPLSALKLHSQYGIPVDPEVFMESDSRLNVGDIVKHSSFMTFDPITLGIDGPLKTRAREFVRFVEEISLQKGPGNMVMLQAKFIKMRGRAGTLLELRPHVELGPLRLSYRFHRIKDEDYKSVVNTYVYLIDLNTDAGKKTLRKLILENYVVSFIDIYSEDPPKNRPGMEFVQHIRDDSDKNDFEHMCRFPGIFDCKYAHIQSVSEQKVKKAKENSEETEDHVLYNGQNLHLEKKEVKSFFGKLFRFLTFRGYSEVNKNLNSHMRIDTGARELSVPESKSNQANELTVRYEMKYHNDFSNEQEFRDLVTIDHLVTGSDAFYQLKDSVDFDDEKPLRYGTVLSFNEQHMWNILSAHENDIYRIAAETFLGQEYAYEWTDPTRRALWDRPSSGLVKLKRNQVVPRGVKVIEYNGQRYVEHPSKAYRFDDKRCFSNWPKTFISQAGYFLSPTKVRSCQQAYRWTKKLIEARDNALSTTKAKERIAEMVKAANRFEMVSHLQLILKRLAELPEGSPKVRFISEIYAPALGQKLVNSNGELYEIPYTLAYDMVPDIEHQKDQIGRIERITMFIDKDSPQEAPDYYAQLVSRKKFINANGTPMHLKFNIRKYKTAFADDPVTSFHRIPLPEPEQVGEERYVYLIKLTSTEGSKLDLSQLRQKKTYSVITNIVNNDGLWISEQKEVIAKRPKIESPASEEDNEEEAASHN